MQLVYIFNTLPEPIRLSIGPASEARETPIIDAPRGDSTPPYRLSVQQVQRSEGRATSIAFINGQDNSVVINTPTARSKTCQLPIPAMADNPDNLFLYIFYSFMLLMSSNGRVLTLVEIDWTS